MLEAAPITGQFLPTAILTWLGSKEIKRGDRLEYHRGYLPKDSHKSGLLSERELEMLTSLKSTVWDLYERRMATLVQRRHGPFDYSYLIVKS